jgi:hypothetical protein
LGIIEWVITLKRLPIALVATWAASDFNFHAFAIGADIRVLPSATPAPEFRGQCLQPLDDMRRIVDWVEVVILHLPSLTHCTLQNLPEIVRLYPDIADIRCSLWYQLIYA